MKKCIACGEAANYKEYIFKEMMFGTRDSFTYLECSNCGCLQIKQVPDDLSKYYPDNYYSLTSGKINFLKSFLQMKNVSNDKMRKIREGKPFVKNPTAFYPML